MEAELARAFVASGFDQKFLIRAITRTRAYQLSSRLTHPSQADGRGFARMNVKGMTGEQLFDSLAVATGYQGQPNNNPYDPNNVRLNFLRKFASAEKRTEVQMSILQALTLMNGKLIQDQTSLEHSDLLAAIVDAPFLSTSSRLETLFLVTLARQPTDREREKFASYVDRGGAINDKSKAVADVMWALLNSSEFFLNH